MSEWHAFIEDDDEGNICIYLQRGSDVSTRELYEMIEADIKDEDGMSAQEAAYLAEAEEEADSRNEEESDE